MKIKYNKELLDVMSLFSSLTGARLRDCFEIDETFYFIVEPGQIGRAVGKKAANVKKLQEKLNKKIRIAEFSPDLMQFVRNLVFPFRPDSVDQEDGTVVIKSQDRKTKGLLIGRNAKNLKTMTDVVKRYFPIEEIKVE